MAIQAQTSIFCMSAVTALAEAQNNTTNVQGAPVALPTLSIQEQEGLDLVLVHTPAVH